MVSSMAAHAWNFVAALTRVELPAVLVMTEVVLEVFDFFVAGGGGGGMA